MTAPFRVHVVAIGEYDQRVPDPQPLLAPDVYRDAARIAGLLTERLGGRLGAPLREPGLEADRAWMIDRLDEWVASSTRAASGVQLGASADSTSDRSVATEPFSSILVWTGHGDSKGHDGWLSAADSGWKRRDRSLDAESIADAIRRESFQRARDAAAWTIIIVQACRAQSVIDAVLSALTSEGSIPDRLVLVFAGGEGQTDLGVVARALENTLDSYTDNDAEIDLIDFSTNLASRLASSSEGNVYHLKAVNMRPIPRRPVLPDGITATQDVVAELTRVLSQLDEDQRAHFMPKARGGEQSELTWYFSGREPEREYLATWLRESGEGMLVVTGAPGSGKSALLGYLVATSNSRLRKLLVDVGVIPDSPERLLPPDDIFDAAIALTGRTTDDVITAIWGAAASDGEDEPIGSTSERIDALLERLRHRVEPFTLLFDALDEAEDPLTVAAAILRRAAVVPGCRMIVGARRSTHLTLDVPDPGDENLIDALGDESAIRLDLASDSPAVAAYVRLRLRAARAAEPDRLWSIDDEVVDVLADSLAVRGASFLFARLLVHEVIAVPELASSAGSLSARTHTDLFLHAVERLGAQRSTFAPLLRALAQTEGRGIPRIDRLWVTAATALHDAPVTEDDVTALLEMAAPYVMLDAEGGQSVYRLAHRTFQESLRKVAGLDAPATRRLGVELLARASELVASDAGRALNPFLRLHLPSYIADADLWDDLAAETAVLDRIDFRALASQAYRSLFGRGTAPREIASAIADRDDAHDEDPHVRAWQRLLGRSRWSDLEIYEEPHRDSALTLRWVAREHPHVLSVVMASGVSASAAVPAGTVWGPAIVTGHSDGSLAVWSVDTGLPLRSVEALARPTPITEMRAFRAGGGRPILVTRDAAGDLTFWDLERLTPFGTLHKVSRVEVVPRWDGEPVVVVESGTGVGCWDPATGECLVEAKRMPTTQRPVGSMLDRDGRLLTAGLALLEDNTATLALWDHGQGRRIGRLLSLPAFSHAFAFFPRRDGVLMVTKGARIVVFDPSTGGPAAAFSREDARITAIDTVMTATGAFAIVGYNDGTVLLADDEREWMLVEPDEHADGIRRVEIVTASWGHVLVVVFRSSRVRLFDRETEKLLGDFIGDHAAWMDSAGQSQMLESDGQPLLIARRGSGRPMSVWRVDTGHEVAYARIGDYGTATVMLLDDGRLVAIGREGGQARLWDLRSSLARHRFGDESGDFVHQRLVVVGGRVRILRHGTHSIEMWDPAGGARLLAVPSVEADGADGAPLLVNGREAFAAVDDRGSVRVFVSDHSREVAYLPPRDDNVLALDVVEFADGQHRVIVTYEDQLLRVWGEHTARYDSAVDVNLPTQGVLRLLPLNANAGKALVVIDRHTTLVVIDLGAAHLDGLSRRIVPTVFTLPSPVRDHSDVAIVHHPGGGRSLAYIDVGDWPHLVDLSSGEITSAGLDFGDVTDGRTRLLSPADGEVLLVVERRSRQSLEIWDLGTMEQIGAFPPAWSGAVTTRAFHWADGTTLIAIAGRPGRHPFHWLLWDPTTRSALHDAALGDAVSVHAVSGAHGERLFITHDAAGVLALRDIEGRIIEAVRIGDVLRISCLGSHVYCESGSSVLAFDVTQGLARPGSTG